jgi:glycosyltransferase involved in cell wall biosynthesis
MLNNSFLKTSVVICTYNGSQFIEEQLKSIYNQTQKVDEVLIFDDRSTDSTVEICKNFIKSKQLKNWVVTVNSKQLGVFKNFINGSRTANEDVIFFSDQDDIWCEDKVEKMVAEFEKHPDMLSLTTTFTRFNKNVVFNKHVKHPKSKRNNIRKIGLHNFFVFPNYLGMSMAISKNLLSIIDLKKDLKSEVTHDIYLNFFSAQNQGLYHLDKILTKRRSYGASVSNKKFKNDIVYFNNNIKLYTVSDKLMMLRLFKKKIKNNLENSGISIQIINKHIIFNNIRFFYLKDGNLLKWLKSIVFLSYYNSFLSYLSDGFEVVNTWFKMKRTRDAEQ